MQQDIVERKTAIAPAQCILNLANVVYKQQNNMIKISTHPAIGHHAGHCQAWLNKVQLDGVVLECSSRYQLDGLSL